MPVSTMSRDMNVHDLLRHHTPVAHPGCTLICEEPEKVAELESQLTGPRNGLRLIQLLHRSVPRGGERVRAWWNGNAMGQQFSRVAGGVPRQDSTLDRQSRFRELATGSRSGVPPQDRWREDQGAMHMPVHFDVVQKEIDGGSA